PADARAPGDGIVTWAMSHRQPAAPLRYTRDWTAGTPSSDGARTDGDTYLQDYTELSGRGYSSAPAVPPRAALVPPARMETMSLREAAGGGASGGMPTGMLGGMGGSAGASSPAFARSQTKWYEAYGPPAARMRNGRTSAPSNARASLATAPPSKLS